MKPGRFIVVEGLEGAGKSSAIEVIKQYLEPKVSALLFTREPGGTQLGEVLRKLIKEKNEVEPLNARSELLLFYAARTQLVEQVIRPALAKGQWVVADRFELSTFAYQGGGRHLDLGMIRNLSEFCLENFKPDLTLFLDLSPEQGLQRAKIRGAFDRMEEESLAFFHDVYKAYHQALQNTEHTVCIDASQPLVNVQKAILNQLSLFLERNHYV